MDELIQTVNEAIINSLIKNAEASVSATCKVAIGSINIFKCNGCTVHIENMCSASAIDQVEAIKSAVIEVFNTDSDILNIQDFSNYIDQTCLSKSMLEDNTKINNININECNAPTGEIIVFKFINTGTNAGQCAMKYVFNKLIDATNKISRLLV